jgi:CubicO group peptidase (beta-lactamase class C family)
LLFDEDWPSEPITVLHLATHTSGLPRLSISQPQIASHPNDPYLRSTRDDLLDWLRAQCPSMPEAPKHSYSNLGYAVLGLMLERAAGKSYNGLLTDRLLEPLGMSQSGLHLTGQPDRARNGYRADGMGTEVWHFDGYAPCGALVSTAKDMTWAIQAMVEPEGWMAEAMVAATQPRVTIAGGDVGLAWIVPRGGTWTWHNGATFGYTAYLGVNRQRRYGVVILCNQFLPAEVTELGHHIMRLSENSRDEEGV